MCCQKWNCCDSMSSCIKDIVSTFERRPPDCQGMCVVSAPVLYLHPLAAKSCTEVFPLQQVKEVQTVGISAHSKTVSPEWR